jgi:segregation and condensation protein B
MLNEAYNSEPDHLLMKQLEALLHAAKKALSVEELVALFPEGERPSSEQVQQSLSDLQLFYKDRGVVLALLSSGFRFQTNSEFGHLVSRLFEEKPSKYSRAFMETLALVAYRQPITRSEIEEIRGVSVSSPILKTLQEHEWIRIIGHREVPGRPALYATTKAFLDHFGLNSLEQLPPLAPKKELKELELIAENLQKQARPEEEQEQPPEQQQEEIIT